MWQPLYTTLENFISHKDTKYDYKLDVPEIINGLNLDDDGQESNGSGKSAIVEATFHTLTGSVFRKVKQDELIRNDCEWAKTGFAMYNTQTNHTIEITRRIHAKKATELEILKDGEEMKFSTVRDGDKLILELLGITREDLMSYFIVSKDNYTPFLTSSDTKKKETIARFSGADAVGHVDDIIGEEQKQVEQKITENENKRSSIRGRIEAYEEQLENVETKAEQKRKNKEYIKSLHEKIEQAQQEIEDSKQNSKAIREETIPKKNEQIEEYESEIEDLKKKRDSIGAKEAEEKIAEIDEKEKNVNEKRQKISDAIMEYEEFLTELKKNLQGVVECPECHHEFSIKDKSIDVEAVRDQVPTVEDTIHDLKNKKSKAMTALSTMKLLRQKHQKNIQEARKLQKNIDKKIDELESKIRSAKNQIRSLESMIERDDDDIEMAKERIKDIEADIEEAKNRKVEDKKAPIEKNIKKAQKEISELDDELGELQKEIEKLQQWSHRFKKFRTHLSNKSIMSIEAFTNFYLKKMHCNLSVSMEGYKVLTSGEVRDNITIQMKRNGVPAGSFDKFSGGEKVRVLIANILCLQKLINLNISSGGLDLLFLDEIIESVDPQGANEILKSLTLVNQTVRVITHTPISNSFVDDVTVVKEGGFSRLENDINVTDFIQEEDE